MNQMQQMGRFNQQRGNNGNGFAGGCGGCGGGGGGFQGCQGCGFNGGGFGGGGGCGGGCGMGAMRPWNQRGGARSFGENEEFSSPAAFAGRMQNRPFEGKGFKGCGKSCGTFGGKGFGKDGMKGGMKGFIPTKKVFVGGLPKEATEDVILEYFANFGEVVDLKVVYDDEGISKGFCFLTYDSEEAAQAAMDNHEHNAILGKWVDVKHGDIGRPNNPGMGGMGNYQGQKPGDWICPQCADLVFARRDNCNMCGFCRTGAEGVTTVGRGKPGDWICPSCNDLVFSYREACNKCGAARTTEVQRLNMKPGDWICPNCGDLVFAHKDNCKMCATPRPDGLEVFDKTQAQPQAGGLMGQMGQMRGQRAAPY